jgi:putative NIF3 family GTP cyclohydrolase 1 type 2
MVEPRLLVAYCDDFLGAGGFSDYAPNGLQVEGERPVLRLASGVTASAALLDAASEWGADAILVHHGWFWKNENPCLIGIKGRRARTLFRAGASLIAYHLPLDAHPEVGNNPTLGVRLGFIDAESVEGLWGFYGSVGCVLLPAQRRSPQLSRRAWDDLSPSSAVVGRVSKGSPGARAVAKGTSSRPPTLASMRF